MKSTASDLSLKPSPASSQTLRYECSLILFYGHQHQLTIRNPFRELYPLGVNIRVGSEVTKRANHDQLAEIVLEVIPQRVVPFVEDKENAGCVVGKRARGKEAGDFGGDRGDQGTMVGGG